MFSEPKSTPADIKKIKADDVRHVLRRLQQAKPLNDTPFRHLMWIKQQFARHHPPYTAGLIDNAIKTSLSTLIIERLEHYRALYRSPFKADTDRADLLEGMNDDFTKDNENLEAWSLLYHYYVRFDLDLKQADLAQALSSTNKNISRRLKHGYQRLVDIINGLEAEARAIDWRRWLLSKLPPVHYSRLIGFDQAQATLIENLENPPPYILALTGPGGIGKSALAHAVAEKLLQGDLFENCAWLILQEPTAYMTFLAWLARDLGFDKLVEGKPEQLEANLHAHLRADAVLIVVDNADLLEGYPTLGSRLAALVGNGRMLLIARQRPALNAPILHYPLGGMSSDDFAALLHEEARRQHLARRRRLDDQLIQTITRAVGVNPLAGRLIIGQLNLLPPERVLANLANLETEKGEPLFDLLFTSTWEAISDDARSTALAMLVPVEGAYWGDLQAILKLSGERLDRALSELVTGSLIDKEEDNALYVMHTLTRRFVLNQARHVPWDEEYRRYLRQAIPQAETTPTEPAAFSRTISLLYHQTEIGEHPENLVALVEALSPTARRAGQWLIWRDVLRYVIKHLREVGTQGIGLARALHELGIAYRWLGETDEARSALEEAALLFGEQGDFVGQVESLLEIGMLHEALGLTEPAYEHYQRAASVGHRYESPEIRRRALLGLAQLALNNERSEEALQIIEEAAATFGDDPPDGQTLSILGLAHLHQGNIKNAITFQEQALAFFQTRGDLPNQARTHMRLGMAYNRGGQPDEALEHLQRGFHLMRLVGDVLGLARMLNNLGVMQAGVTRREKAREIWQEALALQEQLNDEVGMAYTLYNLADLEAEHGDYDRARAMFLRARELAERLSLTPLLGRIENHPLNEDEE